MNIHRRSSLIGKMILGNFLMLLPFLLVISFLFTKAVRSERAETLEELNYLSEQAIDSLDDIARSAYSSSDAFSDNENLIKRIDHKYSDPLIKQAVTLNINGNLFESYNRLGEYERIDAIYVSPHNELFNFLDPNQDEDLVRQKIAELKMMDPSKRGSFHWYPLQPNFLSTTRYNDMRRNNVIFGSRRIYSTLHNRYRYLHIFAIEELSLYDTYKHIPERFNAQVYLLNEDSELLSSSSPVAFQRQKLPEAVQMCLHLPLDSEEVHTSDGDSFYAISHTSDVTGWTLITLLPTQEILKTTAPLYQNILLIFLGCFASFGICLFYLYRKFMGPLRQMDQSMKEVEHGNLQAYVEPCGEFEMKNMLIRYNTMLKGLEHSMTQKLEMERIKRELEMEVLTVQVNPHFLYNTLETIVWKSSAAGHPDIGRIATSLGKMYRLSISGGRFVLLQQELDHLKAYASIQNSRYGDKVSLSIDIGSVDPHDCWVLKLLLQPIVENCYLYAGEDLDRKLKIRVRARMVNDQLQLRITDNGVGMTHEQLEKVRAQMVHGKKQEEQPNHRRSTGIGLHNVYARLQLYRPESTMRILSKEGLGCSVILTMPVNRPKSEEGPD